MTDKVRDLRSALKRLEGVPGQLITTKVEVDPMAELAGVYRYVGAGEPVWVECGIHYEKLSREGIAQVVKTCGEMLEEILKEQKDEGQ